MFHPKETFLCVLGGGGGRWEGAVVMAYQQNLRESSKTFMLAVVPVTSIVSEVLKSWICVILGDPGADSGGEGKSKQAEKYGTKEK